VKRQDYAFPFRIDLASRQASQAQGYERHVEQMIRQVLLTAPGERVDLPEFGCGVRQLLFAPNSEPLAATAQILIQQALRRWLAEHIDVQRVAVASPDDSADSADSADGSQLLIRIEYVLRETLSTKGLEVLIQ
jgi:phage baseplate assembly protein W